MVEARLLKFIKDARKKGYSDIQIRKSLLQHGWNPKTIHQAFEKLEPKSKIKNQVCLFLNDEIINTLNKRAKKNMFTLGEQIEDILRRSCIRKSSKLYSGKVDDLLINCFSRSKRGRKKKV